MPGMNAQDLTSAALVPEAGDKGLLAMDERNPIIKVLGDADIIFGIKADTGAKDTAGHPGGKISEGPDGLLGRPGEYSQMGARFAMWRAVLAVGDNIPSHGCVGANVSASRQALYPRAKCNPEARRGEDNAAMERTGT